MNHDSALRIEVMIEYKKIRQGRTAVVMAIKKFKWGVIGCGYIAAKFTEAVLAHEDMEVTAAAARSLSKAEEFCTVHGIQKAYGGYEEMLADCELDAVYVATVNSTHYDCIRLCFQHNRPVLCEKPMVMSLAEFDSLESMAKEKNLALMEAMWTSFLPSVEQIKQCIEAGDIGKPLMAHIDFCCKFRDEPEGRIFNKDLGGGVIFDIGVYNLHTVFNLFGKDYQTMSVCGQKGPTGVDVQSIISFAYPDGLLVNTVTASGFKARRSLEIYGEKGCVSADNYNVTQQFTVHDEDGQPVRTVDAPFEVNGFEYQIREFAYIVRNGLLESERVSLSTSRAVCQIMEQAYNEITNK